MISLRKVAWDVMSGGGSYHHHQLKVKRLGHIKQTRLQWLGSYQVCGSSHSREAGIPTRKDHGVPPTYLTCFLGSDPLGQPLPCLQSEPDWLPNLAFRESD